MLARFGTGLGVAAVLAAALMWPTGDLMAECRATVRGELARKERQGNSVVYSFAVTTNTNERCSKVEFELVATVRTSEGKEVVRRVPAKQRTTGQQDSAVKINYRVGPDDELIRWEFKVIGCRPCTAEG